jgi:hypothetical protein
VHFLYLQIHNSEFNCKDGFLNSRSQWPLGLRHKLSSPLKHWGRRFESYSRHGWLCVFIPCLCSPVCRQPPCDVLIPRPRSATDVVQREAKAQQKAVEPYKNKVSLRQGNRLYNLRVREQPTGRADIFLQCRISRIRRLLFLVT